MFTTPVAKERLMLLRVTEVYVISL